MISALEVTLDCLTEEQARRHLVSSATTLLGLLKHVTWMQRLWFEECVGGTTRRELGLVQNPEESFRLTDDDTSVRAAHREAYATARTAVADLPLDAVVSGHRARPRTLRRCTCKFCQSSSTTADTPTSCANRVLAG
jgi:hypothetical protein